MDANIVSGSLENNQAVLLELEQLRKDLATAREWLEHEERKNEEIRQERDYERRVFALDNQVLSCTHKIVFLAVRSYILSVRHLTQAVGAWVELPLWEMSKSTGLGREAVGSALKRLHAVGLVERKQKQDRGEGGKIRTTIYVSLTLLSFSLELIPEETEPRNHGGERQTCKSCGSDKLVRRTVIVCKSCGVHQDEPVEVPVNPVDEIDEYVEIQEREREDERKRQERKRQESERLDAQTSDVSSSATSIASSKRPPRPMNVSCKHCPGQRVRWIWNEDDHDYICASCYTPVERPPGPQEGDITWTPF